MATRATRSSNRIAENSVNKFESFESLPTSLNKNRRRQRIDSASSDKIINDTNESNEKQPIVVEVTPPKQGKYKKNPNSKYSPSTLLDRLKINESVPLESNGNDKKKLEKPIAKNKIDNARKVLNIVETEHLYGREEELENLNEFLVNHLNKKMSASMYISGQPGTGKTACVRKILNPSQLSNKFKTVYINCTSLQTPSAIYKAICNELTIKPATDKDTNLKNIQKYFCSKSNKMLLLVLDEIDELIEKKQSVLYTIFEWPTLPNSKIILIGIANSLDLTNRALARLQLQSTELKPKLVHFAPYTKQQIVDIFRNRLEEAGVLDVFPLSTIHLLSAKVAAMSGDVRKALDIGRRVAEIAKQQSNAKDINLNELGIISELDAVPTNDKVELKQVLNVLNNVYSTANTLDDDANDAFPLQQKVLVCTLLLLLKTAKNKDISVGRLHSVYVKVCNKRGIPAIDESEFIGICSLTETKGIIRMIKNKVPRLIKIQLQWDEDEITRVIKDKQLIASILADTSFLDK